jgi:hypothetical protein
MDTINPSGILSVEFLEISEVLILISIIVKRNKIETPPT